MIKLPQKLLHFASREILKVKKGDIDNEVNDFIPVFDKARGCNGEGTEWFAFNGKDLKYPDCHVVYFPHKKGRYKIITTVCTLKDQHERQESVLSNVEKSLHQAIKVSNLKILRKEKECKNDLTFDGDTCVIKTIVALKDKNDDEISTKQS